MTNYSSSREQTAQFTAVPSTSDFSVSFPPQHLLYGGVGLASIFVVTVVIREFRLLVKELRLLASK